MTEGHPLDRPVWAALTGGWASLARGDAHAMRLAPDYGPFAATADDRLEAWTALPALAGDGELWLLERGAPPPIAGLTVARSATCIQMVAERQATDEGCAFVELGEADADEMRALAALTQPGPFGPATHRFGGFVGVREAGRLVAMAGERMRPVGYAEVSGVATHPDFRGRGHAGRLMRTVARRIVQRGEVPFLHVYADNAGAIALYGTLGYRRRAALTLTVLRKMR